MTTIVYDYPIFSMQVFGGVSRYICEIADRVQRRPEWNAHVVAPIHFNQYLADSSIPTLGLYIPSTKPSLRKLYRWTNNLAAPIAMKLTQPDLLHQTYYQMKPLVAKVPVVVTVHDMIHELFPQYFPADDPTSRRKALSVAAADHIICVSKSTAEDLIAVLGVPRRKIAVIPLGCSATFGDIKQTVVDEWRPETRPYVLYVGERGIYKNFTRFIEAYAGSARMVREFDLLVFGGGSFTKVELARIDQLGVPGDSVRWLSGDDEALARSYANARVFVYPSEYEGFGIPVLESMRCGCPVACSNSSSISEVVGSASEFFDPLSVDSIRMAMENVVFNDSRRRALISAGKERSRLFSWDKCADQTIEAYKALL
jgi:glycosyltransferase involved in cell wall biosynthesis